MHSYCTYNTVFQIPGRVFNVSSDSEANQNDWISVISHSLGLIKDIKVGCMYFLIECQSLSMQLLLYPRVMLLLISRALQPVSLIVTVIALRVVEIWQSWRAWPHPQT